MVELKGTVTKKEEVYVEVSSEEISKKFLQLFSTEEIMKQAKKKWLNSKGLDTDVYLSSQAGTYVWKEYQDNGSHYSGYYTKEDKYQEGDEEIMNTFDLLEKLLEVSKKEI